MNLGDSYNAAGRNGHGTRIGYKQETNRASVNKQDSCRPSDDNLKPKDLIGIPWRVAFALQADGWYLRQDIIWHKPNPMPESVTDRCTKAHEYVFLLSKSGRYYYDAEAIKEKAAYDGRKDTLLKGSEKYKDGAVPGQAEHTMAAEGSERWKWKDGIPVRNKRSVWTINTRPYPGAHFAVFPPDLVRPCIKAGSPKGGVVLDPFFGAGTTGLVAQELDRRWIGVELSEQYCELVKQRIPKEHKQKLPEGTPTCHIS